MNKYSWEEAVRWLCNQIDQKELVRACYFDDPIIDAAERFWKSTEWKAVTTLLPSPKGDALDLGAGRGISSYALAREGWNVTALEPDPSNLVGAGAIKALIEQSNLSISVITEYSENLPFLDNSFDLINCRQVLHHAHDLKQTCREIYRVLRPGGLMISTREHVISKHEDLKLFLDSHPLHRYYGGENAFLIKEYLSAIGSAGLNVKLVIAPLDSPINYFPMTSEQVHFNCVRPITKIFGEVITQKIFNPRHIIGKISMSLLKDLLNRLDKTPGRLYSFLAEKPDILC